MHLCSCREGTLSRIFFAPCAWAFSRPMRPLGGGKHQGGRGPSAAIRGAPLAREWSGRSRGGDWDPRGVTTSCRDGGRAAGSVPRRKRRGRSAPAPGRALRLPAGAMPRVTTVATTHATGTAAIGPRRARAEGVGYPLPLRVGRPRLAGEATPAIEGRLVGSPRVASPSAGVLQVERRERRRFHLSSRRERRARHGKSHK